VVRPHRAFLIKHLAFFFVPITVGLMESGRLLAQYGIGIVVTLIASAAVGIVLSGLVSQVLLGVGYLGKVGSEFRPSAR
jgi:holin-like protein